MRIQIIGVGVVGGAQAYLASQLGHEVLGIDRSRTEFEHARILKEMEREVELTFICTQEASVPAVVAELVEKKVKGLHVIKSTVPPVTTRGLTEKHGTCICHNPEFLVEKRAWYDVTHPHVVVIGQCCPEHGQVLEDFYRPLKCPILLTQPTTSETVKLTLNAYLSTLISFWNEGATRWAYTRTSNIPR